MARRRQHVPSLSGETPSFCRFTVVCPGNWTRAYVEEASIGEGQEKAFSQRVQCGLIERRKKLAEMNLCSSERVVFIRRGIGCEVAVAEFGQRENRGAGVSAGVRGIFPSCSTKSTILVPADTSISPCFERMRRLSTWVDFAAGSVSGTLPRWRVCCLP
jgi:hypothetical protein